MMESTKPQFSVDRKASVQKNTLLGEATSSVKKMPLFPLNFETFVPLDFNKIRKEVEEAEKYENSSTEETSYVSNDVKIEEDIAQKNEMKENVPPHQINLTAKSENSFDLDFSVLSFYTPVKKTESTLETPQAKTLPVQTQERITRFNVKKPVVQSILPTKIQCSIPRNPPIHSVPRSTFKNSAVQNNVVCTIPRNIFSDSSLDHLKVNNVEYHILTLLGKGGSSNVYQCFCAVRKKLFAIKSVSLENSASAQGFINEIELLMKLQKCDRVIKLYDYEILKEEKKLLMVLENGGEDFSNILKNLVTTKTNIPVYMLVFYWMEMLHAVKQIHSNGIIHSDLKPSNFVLGNQGLKLIDFGISCSVQSDMTSVFKTMPEGSCNYMSPEALRNDNFSSPEKSKYKLHFKSDVWSLGCILYQLVYRVTPFHNIKNLYTKLNYIGNPNHIISYPEANWVSVKIINMIKKCLQYNAKSRPSVDELIDESNRLCNV